MRGIRLFLLSALLLKTALFSQESSEDQAISPPSILIPTLNPQAPLAQGDVEFDDKKNPDVDDMEALRRWIRDKRLISVKEISGDLSLSGEVRVEFQDTSEVRNGIRQRGQGGVVNSKPQYGWDVEVNIMMDYRTDRTWAALKVEFDDNMGTRSGTVSNIRLEKAYLGGRIIAGDTFVWDAEIGRRYLFNVFDSQIEFSSIYDGLLLRFSKAWDEIGDYYLNIGSLLVDDTTNHYAYVAEMGGLRIANVGLNMKYSIIDWYKPAANMINRLRYQYLVSQYLVSYQFYPEWLGKRLIKFYAAGLCNHLAQGVVQTHGKRQNWGWYAGFSIGLVKKQYDFAINANYQWAQAQVVPEFDVSGIGRGNVQNVGFYSNNINGNPASGATTAATAVGGCNYKGIALEVLYAFTDNLTVLQNFYYSTTLNKNIGPNLRYKQYELEFIYAF